ncbi:hypothetical protein [Parafrankia sp. EUN1f]|nr:hypothetical protein [Parafrankia sp. EUN1f]EFC85787.1 hypothetical protein FrEUN1fDRAFT_1106 [Parafrankia sp. EUN1f]
MGRSLTADRTDAAARGEAVVAESFPTAETDLDDVVSENGIPSLILLSS